MDMYVLHYSKRELWKFSPKLKRLKKGNLTNEFTGDHTSSNQAMERF